MTDRKTVEEFHAGLVRMLKQRLDAGPNEGPLHAEHTVDLVAEIENVFLEHRILLLEHAALQRAASSQTPLD